MSHEDHPYPIEYNGHKDWLQAWDGDGGPQTEAIVHAALYLGEILECLCFETQRQGAPLRTVKWWPPEHPD